jgi:hypothetical protein
MAAAWATASRREHTPSLRSIDVTWELTVLREAYSRSAIAPSARCVCMYRSSRSSTELIGDGPVAATELDEKNAPELVHLLDEHAKRRPRHQDVIDLAGPRVGDGL